MYIVVSNIEELQWICKDVNPKINVGIIASRKNYFLRNQKRLNYNTNNNEREREREKDKRNFNIFQYKTM